MQISSTLPPVRLTPQTPPPGYSPAEAAADEFRQSIADHTEIHLAQQPAPTSLLSKAVLVTGLALSALPGFAATAGPAHLAAGHTVTSQLQTTASDLAVTVLPEGTPRIDLIHAGGSSRVGAALGEGLFQDTQGNLSLVPTETFGWDLGARDFQRVDLGSKGQQSVQRFGSTVQFSESSTRRTIFTEGDHRLELQSPQGKTLFEQGRDGSLHVKGPKGEYTVRHEGLFTRIERPGHADISVLRSGKEIRVVEGNAISGSASLAADGSLIIKSGRGEATVKRSESGLIVDVHGSKGMKDAHIIHDGGTYLGRRDSDKMTVDDKALLAQSKARYQAVMKQLEAVEPGFAEKHPVVASVLEYASANPRLLSQDGGDMGFLQAGTLLASTGGALETVSALGAQAAALNLANSARALGAAALSAQAAAQAQAAAGNLVQASQLAKEAQGFATRAHAAKDQAIKTGGNALKAANVARVMAGVGGALEIVDGVVGIHKGRMDRSLVQGAIAVTEARMGELTSRLQGQDRIEAQDDYDKVMKVMNQLNKQADKKVLVGELKIGLGGLMIVSALLGPEAPPILGAIGIAGTAGTAVYEHWGPIKSFLTGTSNHVPTFLDILPKSDKVVIHLEPLRD